MSSVIHAIQAKTNHEITRVNALKAERQKAKNEIENINRNITYHALDTEYCKRKLQPQMVAALARIAELDKQIVNKWVAPTAKQIEEIDALANRMSGLQMEWGFADGKLKTAVANERQRQEAEARKELAEIDKELPKASAAYIAALVQAGLREADAQ